MGIKFKLVYHAGVEDLDIPAFKGIGDPRIPLIRALLLEMMKFPELKSPTNRMPESMAAMYSTPGSDTQTIEVVLVDNEEAIDLWDAPTGSLGFHCISSGNDESPWSDAHRVVIDMNEDILREHLLSVRLDSQSDIFDSNDYINGLEAWMVTVTHEIAHAIEFIENANGLTPDAVGNMTEDDDFCEEFSFCLNDFCTGAGISQPDYGDEQNEEAMEERVEAIGKNYFLRCMQNNEIALLMPITAAYFAPSEDEILTGNLIERSSHHLSTSDSGISF